MCQEIQREDLRLALLDHLDRCFEGDRIQADELLSQFDNAPEARLPHALDHSRRESELRSVGDDNAAAIHRALLENMKRAAG